MQQPRARRTETEPSWELRRPEAVVDTSGARTTAMAAAGLALEGVARVLLGGGARVCMALVLSGPPLRGAIASNGDAVVCALALPARGDLVLAFGFECSYLGLRKRTKPALGN